MDNQSGGLAALTGIGLASGLFNNNYNGLTSKADEVGKLLEIAKIFDIKIDDEMYKLILHKVYDNDKMFINDIINNVMKIINTDSDKKGCCSENCCKKELNKIVSIDNE